jgi:maltodextrin utilization protein YvdJ
MVIFLLVVSNYKKFQVDDPNYYVLVEEMINKRWYAKNNILINLFNRLIILAVFIVFFKFPKIAGIIMTITQLAYTIYFLTFIRFRKIRYFGILSFGNILTLGIILCIYIGSSN